MQSVTVTSKGQVTIPARLRKELGILEGERLLVVREGNAIKMTPVQKLSQLAGVDREVFKGKTPSKDIERLRQEWTKEFERKSQGNLGLS